MFVSSIKCKNGYFLPRIYATGKLEELLNYDLLSTDDMNFYNSLKFIKQNKTIHTIIKHEGNEIPVVAHLWKERNYGTIIGCVSLESDAKSIENALSLQKNFSSFI